MKDRGGFSPAMIAASNRDVVVLSMLLEAGTARLDIVNAAGMTALACAARAGSLECVSALIAAGADVAYGVGTTPVTQAAAYGRTSAVELLLEAGTFWFGFGLVCRLRSESAVSRLWSGTRPMSEPRWRLVVHIFTNPACRDARQVLT